MPAVVKKKTAAAPVRTKAASAKAPAKKPVGRTRKAAAAPVVPDAVESAPKRRGRPARPVVPQAAKPNLMELSDPKRRVGGLSYKQVSELTGYGLGSEHFIVAVEVLRGGVTRQEVNHRVADLLPSETRNGTPKAVSNLVSGVINYMIKQGFTIDGRWTMKRPASS